MPAGVCDISILPVP